jgi:hypothetical protein
VGRQSDKRSIKSNFILISLLLVVVASLSFVSVYDLIFLDLGGGEKKRKNKPTKCGWLATFLDIHQPENNHL